MIAAALAGRLMTSILLRFRGGGWSALDPGDLYLLSLDADGLVLLDGPFRRRFPNDLWALLAK
jgi:hypothetical protein